ncbi:eCIS core domain-containing protein [Nocardia asiatica]|uniref:eCIS core domain-containing protein n=1 Tax=Nocardia asiatica TaxID=209252 RepID=UPI003EDFE7E5
MPEFRSANNAAPQPDAVPDSVAATVGPIGADLLRAALAPAPPETATAHGELGAGEVIPASIRAPFERSFGYDLSPVRLHRGPVAQRAARSVEAAAFTLGDHIVLGGDLDLAGPAGRHVLAHELAHTVQGRLGSGSGGSGRVSDPSWPAEREAESAASAAVAGRDFRSPNLPGRRLIGSRRG